jgi:Domain of unknown function (DUF4145)
MKCPHCTISFHDNWTERSLAWDAGALVSTPRGVWKYRVDRCPSCGDVVIEICCTDKTHPRDWRMVYPISANRGPVPKEVPADIASDYIEACNVFPISAKASAALSRRCLQNILRAAGYKARDLSSEIDLLLNESDPKKATPQRLRDTIDAIRNFGNFSAHPITEMTALQIIDVDPEEAEWCLEILEACFQHFYVGPQIAKARKDALDAKLAAAGKPPSK